MIVGARKVDRTERKYDTDFHKMANVHLAGNLAISPSYRDVLR